MDNFLNTTTQNVAWFKNISDRNELDVKPPFQRNPVWVTKQKSYLIDTILKGFPIPEIYIQETVDEKGNTKHIIVDGQQRIRAVLEFLEGKFCLDSKDSPDFADLFFEDLTSEQKKDIYKYKFVIRILPQMSDEKIRGIFQRLNKNTVALNNQELRQATYWGPFIGTMNELSDLEQWSETNVFTSNDIRRMLDVEYISELVIALLHGHQNKKQNLDRFYIIYEEEFEEKSFIKKVFNNVLNELISVLPNLNKTRWRKKSDFYTLFLVFGKYNPHIPFSSDIRRQISETLINFGEEIDYLVKTDKEGIEPKNVSKGALIYMKGIRATTDLKARKDRFEGLEMELKKVMKIKIAENIQGTTVNTSTGGG